MKRKRGADASAAEEAYTGETPRDDPEAIEAVTEEAEEIPRKAQDV